MILTLFIMVNGLESSRWTAGQKRVCCMKEMLKFGVFSKANWTNCLDFSKEPLDLPQNYRYFHLKYGDYLEVLLSDQYHVLTL